MILYPLLNVLHPITSQLIRMVIAHMVSSATPQLLGKLITYRGILDLTFVSLSVNALALFIPQGDPMNLL